MTEEKKNIELCQDVLATRVAQMIAERDKITQTEAIRKLMDTQTYGLLLDDESYLYLESAEYILDMYDAERSGDWERWTEA
jgi:myo-inositol-hexaphosphate 3-phosphohydrolase